VHRQWTASDIDDSIFQGACAEVLENFSRPFPFAQLCLVGEGRAGKTALASAFCGRPFEQTESTIGVGIEHLQVAQPRSNCDAACWSPVGVRRRDAKFAEEQLARAVIQVLDSRASSVCGNTSRTSLAPVSNEFSLSMETNPSQQSSNERLAHFFSPPDHAAECQPPASKFELERIPAPAIALDKQLVLQRSTEPESLRIKLMDFGGQKSFYSLHHLYVTRHGVYLLVFNMEWLVGARSSQSSNDEEGGTKRDSSLRFLSFWLNSIYLHAKSPDGSVAPIFLIGTHKDRISSPDDHEAISCMIYEKYKSWPAFGSVVPFRRGTTSSGTALLWFYPVDNTRSCGAATLDVVKSAIHEKLQHEEYLKRAVPLPWLQLYDALQSTKQPHMTLAQVQSAAKQFAFPVDQPCLEAEVARMLKFFTESGLLMHHDCPALRAIVVLDVISCLVTPASIVMCQHDMHMLKYHEDARCSQNEAYLRLTTEGVLCDVLLDTLWSDCIGIKREIVELMMFYGLMVPVLEDCGVASSQYLVPSLLPKLPYSDVVDAVQAHCYFLFGMKTLTLKWEKVGNVSSSSVACHGFLPAGLFARLTGKIVSKCQSVYNFFGAQYGQSEVRACFGSHVFIIRELLGSNIIQLLVMVDNPRKLVAEISQLLQSVISEVIPSLGFCAAVLSDGSCGQNFHMCSISSAHFVALNHITQSIAINGMVHTNSCSSARLSAAESLQVFEKWVAPQGLRRHYDVFLSYRWTGGVDEELTSGLFNNLSEDLVGSAGREIHVFLDKRRLQDGRNFQEDFADALLLTSLPVVILSTAALQRMTALEAHSAIDNLLLEWTLIVELLHSKTIRFCLPIIVGSYSPTASSCSALFSDFFNDVVKNADGTVSYCGIDSLPDVSVASIVAKVRSMLRAHNVPESPHLSTCTVRSVVKHLSLHKAVFVSEVLAAPQYQKVPQSHMRQEAARVVINHCNGSIRAILDSIHVGRAGVTQHHNTSSAPPFLPTRFAPWAAAALGVAAASFVLFKLRGR
jgi:GTPase SAR1 family protein